MSLPYKLSAPAPLWALLAAFILPASPGGTENALRIPVSAFDPSKLEEDYEDPKWSVLRLPKRERTEYSLVEDATGPHIRAVSQKSASGLVYAVDIDPQQFPIIEWTWKIDSVLEKGDLTKKSGDDYAARIYLTFDYDPSRLSWGDRIKYTLIKTFTNYKIPLRALNFVWANKAPQGTLAPNPYTNWVYMIAAQSGNRNAGEWQTESFNVLDHYRKAFGEEPMRINGVAIMTDSDDTKASATGYYKDIVFRKEP